MRKSCVTCLYRKSGALAGQSEKCVGEFSRLLHRYPIHRKGTAIFNQGQPASNGVYFLCQGWVKLTKLQKRGDEVILDILIPCSVIGEIPNGGRSTHVYSAISCEESVEVAYLAKEDLESLFHAYPALALSLSRHLSKRLSQAYRSLGNIRLSVRERVISVLARVFRRLGRKGTRGVVAIPLSYRELAQLVQTTPETLSRVLRSLQEEGLVRTEKKGLRILKEDLLDKYLQENCAKD